MIIESIESSKGILEQELSVSYKAIAGRERSAQVPRNLQIFWQRVSGGDFLAVQDPKVHRFMALAAKKGLASFGEMLIAHTLVHLMELNGLAIPFSGEGKRNYEIPDVQRRRIIGRGRASLYETLMEKVDFRKEDGVVKTFTKDSESEQDITSQVWQNAVTRSETALDIMAYDSFSGRITRFVRDFAKQNPGLLIFTTNNRPDPHSPLVIASSDGLDHSLSRSADSIVDDFMPPYLSPLRRHVHQGYLVAQRQRLMTGAKNGEITVLPAFSRNNWPRHKIIEQIKTQIEPAIRDYSQDKNLLCDPLDFQYQVLFRLTTFGVEDIFENGHELSNRLRELGVFDNWVNILKIPQSLTEQFSISVSLLNSVIDEQARIIRHRLAKSDLPIDQIVHRQGIFQDNGWEFKKDVNQINIVNRNQEGQVMDSLPVIFKPVDIELAKKFHQDLHYIHTPRCDMAFGFYLPDESLPFSILATQRVDRAYKQNALLMFGYDPNLCVDFTRLYSKPGVPKNGSSAMFGEAFTYLKKHNPSLQAAISSFMPSYASGLSMLTGGFEVPILIKPGVHYFGEVELPDGVALEHLTKRRSEGRSENLVRSKLPLLPVVELISPLKEPRFEPSLLLGKDMLSI